ncbi:MAG: sigma-54 dependent transcriptional regulator [Xanthomonadales bacterium]|nr:sigma-54 dependent transcriptional regulator [Xanthomonadales bacterium]
MSAIAGSILVADDHPDVIAALKLLFKGEGYRVTESASPAQAVERVKAEDFDVALIDLNYREDTTSGKEGLRLLADLRTINPDLPVIVMTAWGSVPVAVQAMQDGAGDFLEKPWDNQRLLSIVRNQIALGASRRSEKRLAAENALLRGQAGADFIAESAAMGPVMEMVERIAPSAANVLVTGEHGTGKSLIARHIHRLSDRADKPLVTVNVGGLAETVFESEMFGHVKGAFTDAGKDRVGRFEMASGGTLFLDEIANIPVVQQAKLLRVLEEGEFERVGSSRTQKVDVRVISATNADPAELAKEDRFRQDLLFRLNTVEITMPPLRNRREDIQPLSEMFLRQLSDKYGRENLTLSEAALAALQSHSWPGNVRELGHVVERALLMCSGDEIEPGHLHLAAGDAPLQGLEGLPLEEAERMLVQAALERAGGNIMEAAGQLGLSRSAMYRRLEKYGLKGEGGE